MGFSYLCLFLGVAGLSRAIDLTVSSTGGSPASPLGYGLIFEDINHSGDGGVYAELIQNRAFQNNTIPPWTGIDGATLTLGTENPVTPQLPNFVTVGGTSTNGTTLGLLNPGYYGIDIKQQTYTGSFWARGDYTGDFTVSLQSNLTDETFVSAVVKGPSTAAEWTQFNFTLEPPAAAPNSNNTFSVTFDQSQAPAGSLDFVLLSLFPPTFNNRPNGLRPDIMQILGAQPPSFFRFPGGNNLEGPAPFDYFAWNETIGPIPQRPGFFGAWGYQNTGGLGLDEYLDWCVDLNMEPVLALWAGHWLDGTVIPEADFQPVVDDALNELEYILGDTSTQYGALRAQYGHPDPWKVNYVEIGNEETLSGGDASYKGYRFAAFYDAISAAYPDLQIISTAQDFDLPDEVIYDFHLYDRPDKLVQSFLRFNQTNSTNPFLLGETSSIAPNLGDNSSYGFDTPMQPWATWIGSVAEAVYFIGAESFANGVIGSTYAPILQNLNRFQWTPDLVQFAADPVLTRGSTSYEVISLLSSKRFTQQRPITTEDTPGPAYWVGGDNTVTGAKVLKLAVYNATETVTFNAVFEGLPEGTAAQVTLLTAPDGYSRVLPGEENPVVSSVTPLTANTDGGFTFDMPAPLSVGILETADKDGGFGVQGGFGGYGGCKSGAPRASYDWTTWIASGNEGSGCDS